MSDWVVEIKWESLADFCSLRALGEIKDCDCLEVKSSLRWRTIFARSSALSCCCRFDSRIDWIEIWFENNFWRERGRAVPPFWFAYYCRHDQEFRGGREFSLKYRMSLSVALISRQSRQWFLNWLKGFAKIVIYNCLTKHPVVPN